MISIHLTPLDLVDVVKAFYSEVLSKLSFSSTKYYYEIKGETSKGKCLITLSKLFAKFSDEMCRKIKLRWLSDQEKFM